LTGERVSHVVRDARRVWSMAMQGCMAIDERINVMTNLKERAWQ